MTRPISSWDPEESPATTTTRYIESTRSANIQQAWVNPPNNSYTQAPSKSIVVTPSAPTNAPGTPLPVSSASVTEQPYKAKDGSVLSLISVNFAKNTSDKNFDHLAIWFRDYNANHGIQSMTQGDTSPIEFLVQTTGETVSVILQSINPSGAGLPIDQCPEVTITLNGVTTGPPAPSIIQTLTGTPTGYQFIFQPVGGLAANTISCYQVLSSTGTNPLTANVIETYPQTAAGGQITFQQVVPNGTVLNYWVRSEDTSGNFSSFIAANSGAIANGSKLNTLGQLINADQVSADGATYARILASQLQANQLPGYPSGNGLPNPIFWDVSGSTPSGNLAAGTYVAKDWSIVENDGSFFFYDVENNNFSTSAYGSDLLVRMSTGTPIAAGQILTSIVKSTPIPVKKGDVVCAGFAVEIAATATLGLHMSARCDVEFIGGSGSAVSFVTVPGSLDQTNVNQAMTYKAGVIPVSGTTFSSGTDTAAKAVLRIITQVQNTTGSTINTGSNLVCDARYTNMLLGTASNTGGAAVAKYGSMPLAGATPIQYTTTTTSVTFSGTLTGYRTDVNQTPFSASYSEPVTGLSAGSQYSFYIYYDDNIDNLDASTHAQTVQWVGSGTLGTPPVAFPGTGGNNGAVQTCIRSDHIPVAVPITLTLPSSGTGGGSGGGGGQGTSGTCPRSDMLVRHRELGVISAGRLFEEFLKGGEHYIANLSGWTKVTDAQASSRDEWLEVEFGVDRFIGTPYHGWPTDKGLVASCELNGHVIDTLEGSASHKGTVASYDKGVSVRIVVEEPHTYLCGENGPVLLTHNPMIPC